MERPELCSQYPQQATHSQLPVTAASGTLPPSSGLCDPFPLRRSQVTFIDLINLGIIYPEDSSAKDSNKHTQEKNINELGSLGRSSSSVLTREMQV